MLIRTLTKLTVATAAALPLVAAAADDVSYTYLEASYLVQDIDMFEDPGLIDGFTDDINDGDGFQIEGSIGFAQNFFAFASYSSTESDFRYYNNSTGVAYLSDQKLKTFELGLGYALPLSNTVDLVARAAYLDIDYGDFRFGQDDNEFDSDEVADSISDSFNDLGDDASDGYLVDAGIRSQVMPWLEVGAGARYQDLDMGDDFTVFGNALFEINQSVGINLSAEFGDDINVYGLGIRYTFPQ